MRLTRIPLIIILIFTINGCSTVQHIDELSSAALAADELGDRHEALLAYEELIKAQQERGMETEGSIYNRAGILAFELGHTSMAVEYLELARHTDDATPETFFTLALAYKKVDNLSREITNLERYLERYPRGDDAVHARVRLFETLVESMNWDQAHSLWSELPGSRYQEEDLLTGYFMVNRALGFNDKLTEIAEHLLGLNAENITALDWLAKKHFRMADSRYREEMAVYEQNRTHRQYAILLRALEVINTDLHIALDYFKRLYALEQRSEYASYLANIYERFQDDERARYYRQKVTN